MLDSFLPSIQKKVSSRIKSLIGDSNLIEKSMAHTSLASSKMIRAGLLIASGGLNSNIKSDSLISMASAVEMMHSYSLIHDDLPCMDDDDMRRNQPSNHVVFGEANAVLAGDALQALAFEVIARDKNLSALQKVESIKILASACGKNGMIYGQHLDIENENNPNLKKSELDNIHKLKTGKLIESSILLGQVDSGLGEKDLQNLKNFSALIGLAFQIKDDVLDVVGASEKMGKSNLSDQKNEKSTYVGIVGLEESISRYKKLTKDAISSLKKISFSNRANSKELEKLATFIIDRDN